MEIWKDIENFEGIYQVSNMGRVRSLDRQIHYKDGRIGNFTGIILKQGVCRKGYPIVYLSKGSKKKAIKVHRLVALTFVKKHQKKNQVNHIDGDKSNNIFTNLEWCDNSENQIHAYANGLNSVSRGESNGNNKYSLSIIIELKKMLKIGKTYKEIINKLNVSKSLIYHVKSEKTWKYVKV